MKEMEVSDVLFVPPSVIILTIHNYSYEVRKDQRNSLVYNYLVCSDSFGTVVHKDHVVGENGFHLC